MTEEHWTVREVLEIFQIEERFLLDLEEEEVVCPTCASDPAKRAFSRPELEKLRLAKILHEEMGVNLPGVEIIIRMRKDMDEMKLIKTLDNKYTEITNLLNKARVKEIKQKKKYKFIKKAREIEESSLKDIIILRNRLN